MEALLIYLVNASSGIALFYIVYWLFLRKETFHVANRWYLFVALFSAIVLPIFPIRYAVIMESSASVSAIRTITDTFKNIPTANSETINSNGFGWEQALFLVYITGAGIFLLRLLVQSFILIHLMIKHRIKLLDDVRVVENEKYGLPFSFFNIVFINPKFHTQDDLPEILAHEKVHIRENHWFDLLFIELLTVIFWFNPFIWFFERSIKQNHEYLADKGVLAQGHTLGRYQALLLNQLMGMQIIGVTNNLNFALNANRLKMMTKKKTSRLRGVKFVWALPVLALLLFAFAEPDYTSSKKSNNLLVAKADLTNAEKTVKLMGLVLDTNGEPLPGTSVVVKGGTVGTVSNLDGTFSLDVAENSSIVLSFVGKKTIVDSYSKIINEPQNNGTYTRKYKMEDAVQVIFNRNYTGEQQVPPPPPPPADKIKKDKAVDQQTPPSPPPSKTKGTEEIFYIVEDMPQYPGGLEALQDYVSKMQQKIAQSKGVKGKASVSFTVNAKGKVTDIKVVEKDNDDAAKGAVILASEMPDWKPGTQRGKAVSVKYLLPVEFK